MATDVYGKAMAYYAKGWWKLAHLRALVGKGLLTKAQVGEITGTAEDGADLSTMTKAELLDYAAAHGVTASASWTKAEIIEAIEGAE